MKINQLKAGVILTYISLFLCIIIGMLYTPFMLKELGQSEYGLYSLTYSIIGCLAILDLGLGNAIIRYIAKYRALNDKAAENNLTGMFLVLYTLLGILAAVIGFVIYLNINTIFGTKMSPIDIQKVKTMMIWFTVNLSLTFPLSIFGSIIIGHEKFVFSRAINIISIILSPLIMIPLLLIGYKALMMVIIATILNFICLIINLGYCLIKLKVKIHFEKLDYTLLKEIMGYSFFILLNIISDRIFWSSDQVILGMLSSTVTVAIFALASQLISYYTVFSGAMAGVFLPKITAMVTTQSSDKELSDIFIRIGRIQYIIISLILSGFLLFGNSFIILWAGPEYNNSFYIAAIIIIPFTVPAIQNIGVRILQAKNIFGFIAISYVIMSVMNISISFILARIYGAIGCAIGSAVCLIIANVIVPNIYYYKKAKIDIPGFWREIIIMTLPISISVVCGVILNYFINSSNMIILLIKIIIYTIIHCFVMWSFAMNKYEKNLIKHPFAIIINGVIDKIIV